MWYKEPENDRPRPQLRKAQEPKKRKNKNIIEVQNDPDDSSLDDESFEKLFVDQNATDTATVPKVVDINNSAASQTSSVNMPITMMVQRRNQSIGGTTNMKQKPIISKPRRKRPRTSNNYANKKNRKKSQEMSDSDSEYVGTTNQTLLHDTPLTCDTNNRKELFSPLTND